MTESILNTLKDSTLTYQQRVVQLAREAESKLDVLNYDIESKKFIELGIICEMYEGNAPYRPRYILPNYQKLINEGCKFLELDPSTNLLEAVNNLLIFYKHVPSITTFPVYLGNIDTLLDKFITDESRDYEVIKMFLKHIDRTLTDSFVHANIGPIDNIASRLILRAIKELNSAVPNLSLKYSEETSDELAIEAIKTGLEVSRPYFANHSLHVKDLGEDYGVASCYNGLPVSGGAHTLTRVNLKKLALQANSTRDFFEDKLPKAINSILRVIDRRSEFLVEETSFYKSNFLIKEGFISLDRFTSMLGMIGLADCSNILLDLDGQNKSFGHSNESLQCGKRVMDSVTSIINSHNSKHCYFSNGKVLLHSQCGISDDIDTAPGHRIPIGDEPELIDHILFASNFQSYFPSGSCDIFSFDSNSKNNPQYVLDIIKGAMKNGMKMFSFYTSDSDLIRISGYLVKKSEIEKLQKGQQVLRDTVFLGSEVSKNTKILERKIRK